MVCLLIRISLGNPLTRWLSITYHWQGCLVEHSKSTYPSRPDFQPLILICLNLIGDFNFQIPLESHSSLGSSCEGFILMRNSGRWSACSFCARAQGNFCNFKDINRNFNLPWCCKVLSNLLVFCVCVCGLNCFQWTIMTAFHKCRHAWP